MLKIPTPHYKTNFDFITVENDAQVESDLHDTEYSVLWSQGSIGNMQASYDAAVAKRYSVSKNREAIAMINDMLKGI